MNYQPFQHSECKNEMASYLIIAMPNILIVRNALSLLPSSYGKTELSSAQSINIFKLIMSTIEEEAPPGEAPSIDVRGDDEKDPFVVIQRIDNTPYCPIEDPDGNLFVVSNNGDIYGMNEDKMQVAFTTNGQPTGIVFDNEGQSFIADGAHQAILSQTVDEDKIETAPIIKDYEGKPLKGPHSLVLSEKQNILFFSDSGPFGETSLENPHGSLFAIDLTESALKPVLVNSLAFPTGLCLNEDETVLYVAETARNRILKVVFNEGGSYHTSVFKQLSGRFGPTALARHPVS